MSNMELERDSNGMLTMLPVKANMNATEAEKLSDEELIAQMSYVIFLFYILYVYPLQYSNAFRFTSHWHVEH